MKKQIKKLSLNKKTISNLIAAEMNMQVGGAYAYNSIPNQLILAGQTK